MNHVNKAVVLSQKAFVIFMRFMRNLKVLISFQLSGYFDG